MIVTYMLPSVAVRSLLLLSGRILLVDAA
jgi:hypothetical protein